MSTGTERRRFLRSVACITAAGLTSCSPALAFAGEKPRGFDSENKINIFEKFGTESFLPSDFYGLLQIKDASFINADLIREANKEKRYYVFVHSKGELYGTPLDLHADEEGNLLATSISEWYLDEEMKGLNAKAINPHFYQNNERKVAITTLPMKYGFPAIIRKEGEKDKLYFAGIDSSYKIIHGPFDLFVSPGELAVRYGYEGSPNEVAAVSMRKFGSQLSGQLLVDSFSGKRVALKFIGNKSTEKLGLSKNLEEQNSNISPVDIGSLNR